MNNPKTIIALVLVLFFTKTVHCQVLFSSNSTGFIANRGQIRDQHGHINPDVCYLLPLHNGLNVQLKNNGFSYDTYQIFNNSLAAENIQFHRVDVEFVNANPYPEIIAEAPAADVLHFPAAVVSGVQHYKKVIYREVYPYIDLEFIANPTSDKLVEYNFILRPGARVSDIQLRYVGALAADLGNNTIRLKLTHGKLTEHIPASYWSDSKNSVVVDYQIIKKEKNSVTVGFTAPMEIVASTLVIDPVPRLDWGTYLGDTGDDSSRDMTLDASGNVYITGSTNSTAAIATTGTHQTTISDSFDAFVAKFNTDGVRQWSTYLGGSDNDFGQNIALDNQGNVFIAGASNSNDGLATSGTYQPANSGGGDGFLVKFDHNGIRLWGTFLGGSGFEFANALAIDNAGNAYVSGWTLSTDVVGSPGTHQPTFGGDQDAFLAKFDANGNGLWWTFFGDIGEETGLQLAITNDNNVLLSGWASSATNIATPGAFQTTYAGGTADAFLAQFNPNGQLNWATYYGGSAEEFGDALAIDNAGNIYMGGPCNSPNGLATPGSHQTSINGISDAFLVKFNSAGTPLWGTYYGGSNEEASYGIATDGVGNVYLTGFTKSNEDIATPDAHQTTFGGGDWDAFLAKFDSDGNWQWGSYYGGAGSDQSYAIAVDGQQIFVAGVTSSAADIATTSAHQSAFGGASDAFVARFAPCTDPVLNVPNGGYLCRNEPFVLELKFSGDAPFTFVYTIDGVEQAPITTSDTTFNFSLSAAQYQDSVVIIGVSSAECQGTITGLPFIRVLEPLSNTVPIVNCDAGSQTYTVTFQLSGNEPFNYIASAGFISGNVYTSPPIPFGQDYDIQITTTLGCDTLSVSGTSGCAVPCEPLNISGASNSPLCENQNLNLTATGGETYTWSGPNNFSSNEQNPVIANVSLINSGIYKVVVTDANGCMDSTEVEVTINAAPVFNTPNFTFCSNEAVVLTASGGSGALQYSMNGANFQMNNTFSNLNTGTYNAIARDTTGCTDTATVNIVALPVLNGTVATLISCDANTSTLTINASGSSVLEYSLDGTNFAPTNTFPNLSAGTYTFYIRDQNGCTINSTILIAAEDTPTITAVEATPTTCAEANGVIAITASGGAGMLEYSINGGANYQASNRFDSLQGGNYAIVVKDQNNCIVTTNATVAASAAPPTVSEVRIEQINCETDQNTITVNVSGGNGKSVFSINGADFQESNRFTNLRPGNYTITVKDDTGCTAAETVNIAMVSAPVISNVEVRAASCEGNNGQITIIANGGTGALSYALNDSLTQSSNVFANLNAGNYTLTVTDESGCRDTQQATIRQEDCPIYIPNVFSPNGDGVNDEFIVFAASGVTGTVVRYQIFDRWGNLMHEAVNFPLNASGRWWDGKTNGQAAPAGVYVFYVAVELADGNKISEKGEINLVR